MIRTPNRFYIYALLDTRKPGKFIYTDKTNSYEFEFEPFYIGLASTPNRPKEHFRNYNLKKDTNKLKCSIIKKIIEETGKNPNIFKIIENITDDQSTELEKTLIKLIGKRIDNNGPLSNIQDGGKASPVGKKRSIDQCIKAKKLNLGRCVSPEEIEKRKLTCKRNKYKVVSPTGETFITPNLKDFCNIHDLNYYGFMDGHRNTYNGWKIILLEKNTSEIQRFNSYYRLTYYDGTIYTTNDLNSFSKEFDLNSGSLMSVATGKKLSHMGFTVDKIDINTMSKNELTHYYEIGIYNYYIYLPNGTEIKTNNLRKASTKYNLTSKNFAVCILKKKITKDYIAFKIKKSEDNIENRNILIEELRNKIILAKKSFKYVLEDETGLKTILYSNDLPNFCKEHNLNYVRVNYHIKNKNKCIYKNYKIKKVRVYQKFLDNNSLFTNPEEI